MSPDAIDGFLAAVEFPRLLEILSGDCQTVTGKDYLKSFRPLSDTTVIESRLRKTQELEKYLLKNNSMTIPDSHDFQKAFNDARTTGQILSAEELASLYRFLADVTRLRQALSLHEDVPVVFQSWLDRLHALPSLCGFLKEKITDKGEVMDSASAELKSIRDELKSLRVEIQGFYQKFIQRGDAGDVLQEKIITEREGRWVVPVRRDHQSAVPGFVHGLSASGATLFVEPQEIIESNNRVREALLREDEEIRLILREATQRVLESGVEIAETLDTCAEIDAHGALAYFASRYDGQFVVPQAAGPLKIQAARHPLLALEAKDQFREKVVPLDLVLENDVRVMLVSGPNAGGKTVGLKTLGLSCVMAQSGLPLLARAESCVPVLVHFDTDLQDGQSLSDHLSTYAAKLTALKRMLDQAGPQTLYLLDELGAGTDPREGGALGLACLEVFREKGALVMANTHQPLLKLLTQEEKGMANAAMLFDEVTGQPTFRLVSGIPGRSYALTLAKQMGFNDELLERAKQHLPPGEADLSDLLAKLGQEKEAAEKARREAEKIREGVKKTEQELLIAKRQIKDEAKNIKKAAQVEAEGIVRNTRRQMEHLIQGVKTPTNEDVNKDRIKNAKRMVNQKLKNVAPPPEKLILEVSDLKEGEKVLFKPGDCDVKIIGADEEKGEAVIQMGNGMKLSCKYSDLGRVSKAPPKLKAPLQIAGVLSAETMDKKGSLEIDLRGKMVDQALPLVDKFLDDALLTSLPFVRIIHGKGTGALRVAIHKHLPLHHPNIEFSMAEPSQGGAGVTVVKFKK
jgi:DNA mismatch repair protein MutS2